MALHSLCCQGIIISMDDESAQERQTGPIKPREWHAPSLPWDSVWAEYMNEYARLKASGVDRMAAVSVFRGLLSDPDRKASAELMLATATSKAED